MIVDWGQRTHIYPRSWHPAIIGIWDWGNTITITITGRMHMELTWDTPEVLLTRAGGEIELAMLGQEGE